MSTPLNQENPETHTRSTSSTPSPFDCNICFEQAKDPVVTVCGHLFCWPCLCEWQEQTGAPTTCPVCKAGVTRDRCVPLYGRGQEAHDPRADTMPRRPPAARPPEPQQPRHFHGFPGGPPVGMPLGIPIQVGGPANFSISLGFGLLPGLFGLQFGFPQPVLPEPGPQRRQRILKILEGIVFLIIMLAVWHFV